jgi:hypothetical protein
MTQTKVEAPFVANNAHFKNLLANGDMAIAQRGTSFSLTNGNSQFPVDRFKIFTEGSFAYTVSQSTDVPTGKGFTKSLKVDVTTGNASPSTSSQTILQTNLEGQMLQHLCKGTSDAKKLTLSFYVKCTATGNLQVNLRDLDNARIIANTFTINSADTWEFKTITFAGDTSGAFDNDNASSLRLGFMLGTGTDYKGGAVPTSWEALSSTDKNAGDTLNFSSSASNDFFITGVQLEVGDQATDFEHLPHDVQLQRCKRYFQNVAKTASSYICNAWYYTDTKMIGIGHFEPEMRATPSLDAANVTDAYVFYAGGSGDSLSDLGLGSSSSQVYVLDNDNNVADDNSVGRAGGLYRGNSVYVHFDAEL